MVALRDVRPGRLDGHRLWSREVRYPGTGGWLVRGPRRFSGRRGLGFCEELVHDLGAGGDDGPEFAAVDDLGGAGGGVPGEAGDLLDGDSLVAQQADEGGAQLARGPAVPGTRLDADALEHLPDVSRVQRGAQLA